MNEQYLREIDIIKKFSDKLKKVKRTIKLIFKQI